tara:strand:+ start:445 stop:678 length:234 start_codon:yes stop_codon:yes gene_type:complete
MKTLFIVDHFIPFPQSEYGGLWNVLADSDEECFDLITSEDGDNYPEYYSVLRENIAKCDKYTVTSEVESGIVSSFLT